MYVYLSHSVPCTAYHALYISVPLSFTCNANI